jgi:CyaY protein
MASLSDNDYHQTADDLLRRIEAQADAWLPDRSKVVVNMQPPLHEVWLASRAGGFHFQWGGSAWVDTKTGHTFESVFNEQVSLHAGRALVLGA